MAYDEGFADRVRSLVAEQGVGPVTEKRMFGGLAFLLGGNMAVGVHGNDRGLMVRVDPDQTDALAAETGAAVMEMRGRAMRGWITVAAEALTRDAVLRRWVERGVAYAGTLPPK
jgi:TfoX/Sxy family transcriptional regulator of competence genes